MLTLDIFNNEAFRTRELTDAVLGVDYVPNRIGAMGLFEEKGVSNHLIEIEEKNGTLRLLQTQPRGGPAPVAHRSKRNLIPFRIPHIPLEDAVLAEEIQGVRAFGTADQLETVKDKVMERLAEMRQSFEATHEYHRIGAIKGIVYDADGTSVLTNLFTAFGLTQTSVAFALGTTTTDVREKVLTVVRAIETALGGVPYTSVRAFCGKTWFGKLIKHTDVKEAYALWRDGEARRNDPRAGFELAGCTFEEYRGRVNGQDFISDDEAAFYPVGVPGLFKMYYGPADFMETANTPGVAVYAKQERMDLDRGVRLHCQSNPLAICTRPAVLVKGTTN